MQDDGKDASKTRTKSNKWSLCGIALNVSLHLYYSVPRSICLDNLRKSDNFGGFFGKLAELAYFRHRAVHLTEPVSRADKRDPREISGIQVALGIADVHRLIN